MAKKKTLTMPEIQGITQNPREMEIRVLSSCLYGDEQDAILALHEDAFTHKDLRCVFRVMKEMRENKKPIELTSVIGELNSDRLTLLTFENIQREKLGEEWTGGTDEIRGQISRLYMTLAARESFLSVATDIEALKRAYIANIGKKAAVILQNSANLTPGELNSYLSTLSEDLSRATQNNIALFESKTAEQIAERRKINHDGIGTNYYVFSEGNRREITIPPGAITLVCGLPGHCKSTMLLNLALRFAHSDKINGSVIYWTFEESDAKADEKIQNLNFGHDLNKKGVSFGGNIERIREYHKGKTDYMGDIKGFEESLKELETMETSGRLKLVSAPVTSLDFVSSLRAHMAKTSEKVAAVFVDYIQIIKSGRNLEARHDIAEALNDFLTFAKETNIPVIAAAQLNREAATPQRMGGKNIAESADLTRFADTIICLWNPTKREDVDLDDTKFEAWKSRSWYKEHLLQYGCEIEKPGTLYVKITKSRDMESGADAVYTYNGNTRAIGRPPKEAADLPKTANPDNLEKETQTTKPAGRSWNYIK